MSRCQYPGCGSQATGIISLVPAEEMLNTETPAWKFERARRWVKGGVQHGVMAFARVEVCDPHGEEVVVQQDWQMKVMRPGVVGTQRVVLEREPRVEG